jgi:MSHA biogenesis protein MshG
VIAFRYTGRSSQGSVNGTLEAATPGAAAEVLMARGVTPLTIRQIGGAAASATPNNAPAKAGFDLQTWMQPKVQPVDKLMFSRQLHTLLKSGVPILRALAGLQDSAVNPRMKQTLLEVRQSLGSGIELSMSMAQHPKVFDGFYVALVRVGEMTGRLEEVFLRLFHHLEFEMFMGQQVKSALRYPIFVITAMVGAVMVINLMVIPAFATVFKSFGAELPLPTRILVAASEFTLAYGWLMLFGAIAGAWATRHWIATPEGCLVWDRWKLSLPLAGKIILKSTLARFARSFSLSLKSGVPIEQALSVVAATVDNSHMAKKVEGMRTSVEHGESILRAAVASGVFTPIVLQMIAVGEETGAVDELMDEVAELYTNDVQYDLKTLAQQIEPILIIFLGIVVLVLALGVFLPVWDLGRVAFKH